MPYTFYPVALPHWIAWTLFLLALVGAALAGFARVRKGGWASGICVGAIAGISGLFATMIASMVITFFVHDQ